MQDDIGHGQMLDSDSMLEFDVHRDSKYQRSKRSHRRSGSKEKSSGDSKSHRSRDKRMLSEQGRKLGRDIVYLLIYFFACSKYMLFKLLVKVWKQTCTKYGLKLRVHVLCRLSDCYMICE